MRASAFAPLCLALAVLAAPAAFAFNVPPAPARFLYDGAGVLRPEEKQALENQLMELNQRGLQVGVALFSSLEGEPLEDVSGQIFSAWKPGQKGKDDGVLLTAFMKDRKMRIEVGYGLEGQIPDALASRILQEQLKPEFRAGNFGGGIQRALTAISAAALGQAMPAPSPRRVARRQSGGSGLLCVGLMFFFVLTSFFRAARRPRMFGSGGRSSGLPWWAWMLMGSSLSNRRHGGGGWGGSGGGGWGGGGGGSFGGGSFGGGGSSGSW